MPSLLSRLFSFLGLSGLVKIGFNIFLIVFLVNMIDVSTFEKIPEYVQSIVDKSSYLAHIFALDLGFAFISTAYVYRFVMRRLEKINL